MRPRPTRSLRCITPQNYLTFINVMLAVFNMVPGACYALMLWVWKVGPGSNPGLACADGMGERSMSFPAASSVDSGLC
jgi:hypothetical protein